MCQGTRTLSLRLSSRAGTILRGVCPPLHDRSQGHPRTAQRFPQCKDGHGRVSSMGKHNPQRPHDMRGQTLGTCQVPPRPWGQTSHTGHRHTWGHLPPHSSPGMPQCRPFTGNTSFLRAPRVTSHEDPFGTPPKPCHSTWKSSLCHLFLIPPQSSPSSRPVVFPTYQCHPRPHLSMSPRCPRRIHSSARPIPCQPLLTQCSPDPSLFPSPQ